VNFSFAVVTRIHCCKIDVAYALLRAAFTLM